MNNPIVSILIKTGIILSLIGAFGVYYYKNKSIISELNQELSSTKLGYDSAIVTIEELNKNSKRQQEEASRLNKKIKEANQQRNALENTLAKHDLEYLAYKKPKLIENRINSSTKKVLQEFEEITKNED